MRQILISATEALQFRKNLGVKVKCKYSGLLEIRRFLCTIKPLCRVSNLTTRGCVGDTIYQFLLIYADAADI